MEVKTGKGKAGTALKALESGKADRLLYLKGNTKVGTDGKIVTVPIYMLENISFKIYQIYLLAEKPCNLCCKALY